jgi:hypothetical protein
MSAQGYRTAFWLNIGPKAANVSINSALFGSANNICSQTHVRQAKLSGFLAMAIIGTPCRANIRAVCSPVMQSSPITIAYGFLFWAKLEITSNSFLFCAEVGHIQII